MRLGSFSWPGLWRSQLCGFSFVILFSSVGVWSFIFLVFHIVYKTCILFQRLGEDEEHERMGHKPPKYWELTKFDTKLVHGIGHATHFLTLMMVRLTRIGKVFRFHVYNQEATCTKWLNQHENKLLDQKVEWDLITHQTPHILPIPFIELRNFVKIGRLRWRGKHVL
jgi:hypothetical protein